jgi:stearoyl-CoA desaturase (delta-9 desaturase)
MKYDPTASHPAALAFASAASTNLAADARTGLNRPATFVYVLLHVGCLGVFYTGISARAIAVLGGAYLIRAIGVSLVYHRYFAHRTFRTSRAMQFVLGLYGTMTVLGGPLWWAQTHREHHRHADTPDDIHSPYYQGFIYSHCGWFLDEKHRSVDLSAVRDLARFPELLWLERWSDALKLAYVALCYGAFGVVGIVWGFFVPTVITMQMVHWIQSISHSIGGYRRYPLADDSRNHWLFGILSLGEGFHHNHHCFPHSARLGLRWWEFDFGYWILIGLSRLGLIWDVRAPSRSAAAGKGGKFERSVDSARTEFDGLARRLDATLADFQQQNSGDELAVLRARIASHIDAFSTRSREILIAGSTARRRADDSLRAVLLADVAAAFAGHVDGRVEQIKNAILGFRREPPAIDPLPMAL